MPVRQAKAGASAYWSITNTLNLARIASRGVLGAIALYGANYDPDESIDFGGLLVLRDRKSVASAAAARRGDIGLAVLELRLESVPSELRAPWEAGPADVTLLDGALPVGAIERVHFPSGDALEDHESKRFANVDWNVFSLEVSPDLFDGAATGEIDETTSSPDEPEDGIETLPMPPPESRLGRQDVELVDRLTGALVMLVTTVPHNEERVAEVDEVVAIAVSSSGSPAEVAGSCIAYLAAVTDTEAVRLTRACEVLLARPNDDRELLGPLEEFLEGDSATQEVADGAVTIVRALDDLGSAEAVGDRLVWALLMALTTDAGPSLSERLGAEPDALAGMLAAWLLGYRLGATQRLVRHRIENFEPTVGALTARLLNGTLGASTPTLEPRPRLALSVDEAESVLEMHGYDVVELSRNRTKSFNDEAIGRAVGETAIYFAEALGVPVRSVIEVPSKMGTELRTSGRRTTVRFNGRVEVLLEVDESAVQGAIEAASPESVAELLTALDNQARAKG